MIKGFTSVALAGFAAAAVCAGQDPRIDYSFAVPTMSLVQDEAPLEQGQAAPPKQEVRVETTVRALPPPGRLPLAPQKIVSASFKNATLADVLGWMEKEGVSFVIDESVVAGRKVTLHAVEQPVEAVLDGVATILGGHWVRQAGMHAFRQGPGPGHPFMPFGGPDALAPGLPGAPMPPSGRFEERAIRVLPGQPVPGQTDIRIERRQAAPGATVPGTTTLRLNNPARVLATLTPRQKELHKKQGFLRANQLTEEQRKGLGLQPGMKANITIDVNGQKLNVRSG